MNYIYAIKNLMNNKQYIGSTKSWKSRKYQHFRTLKLGVHHSPHLQKSYNKYGKDNFAFYILEECEPSLRKSRELYYISLHKTDNPEFGYNSLVPNEDKFTCSDKLKLKLKEKKLDRCKPVDAYSTENLIKLGTYDSVKECGRILGIRNTIIHSILLGRRKSYKGLTFTYRNQPCLYTCSSKQRNMTKFQK